MAYRKRDDKKFINPYNFVQVDLNKDNTSDGTIMEEQLYSGVLNCKLITKTPIAVPYYDHEDKEIDKHKHYSFFSYDGRLAIPGSTLRGCIRNMYEALTDSCFVTSKDEIITTRTKDAFKPGVLIREEGTDNWVLYKAQRYIFTVKGRDYVEFTSAPVLSVKQEELNNGQFKFGNKVTFLPITKGDPEYVKKNFNRRTNREIRIPVGKYVSRIIEATNVSNPDVKTGYVYIGEKFPVQRGRNGKPDKGKHFESIFWIGDTDEAINKNKVCEFKEDTSEFKGLLESYKIYNDEKVNNKAANNSYYVGFEAAKRSGVIPLWFNEKQDGSIYLSLASIGRYSYKNNMAAMLRNKKACDSRHKVCPACALFGMASNNQGLGSHIRVTEAKLDCAIDSKDALEKSITLRELASPKTSYVPFYIKHNSRNQEILNYDSAGASINGRKMYWHSKAKGYSVREKTKRNATMDLVKPNNTFNFQVYFDKVTQTQLETLLWTLTLGENKEDSTLCYKIGHGKPIGLGSSKLVVESMIKRSLEDGYGLEATTEIATDKEHIPTLINEARAKEVLAIVDMKSTENRVVRYPYIENTNPANNGKNSVAAHKWFNENYSLGKTIIDQKWLTIKEIIEGKSYCAYELCDEKRK